MCWFRSIQNKNETLKSVQPARVIIDLKFIFLTRAESELLGWFSSRRLSTQLHSNSSSTLTPKFKSPASFCDCTAWFMVHLVGNPQTIIFLDHSSNRYWSFSFSVFQLGGGVTGGDMLGGLGDIFGMPQPQSYVPPQEVRAGSAVKYLFYSCSIIY